MQIPTRPEGSHAGILLVVIGVHRDFLVCIYIYMYRERERLITRVMKSQMEKRLENDVEI